MKQGLSGPVQTQMHIRPQVATPVSAREDDMGLNNLNLKKRNFPQESLYQKRGNSLGNSYDNLVNFQCVLRVFKKSSQHPKLTSWDG